MDELTAWLDIDDLSRYLKMPKSTLYKLLERGELPGHKVGRAWRFDREEIDAFIKTGIRKGPQQEELINVAHKREPAAS